MKTFFVIVLVIFIDGTPMEGKVGGPYDTKSECETQRKEAEARVKAADLDAALVCVEVKHKPKPAMLKQRGGNA